jgi:hypothetical protein
MEIELTLKVTKEDLEIIRDCLSHCYGCDDYSRYYRDSDPIRMEKISSAIREIIGSWY